MNTHINNQAINKLTTLLAVFVVMGFMLFPASVFSASSSTLQVDLEVEGNNQPPAQPDEDDDGQQSSAGDYTAVILDVTNVTHLANFLTIDWETNIETQAEVTWRSLETSVEQTSVTADYTENHHTVLSELEANTTYEVEIKATAKSGVTETHQLTLTTSLPAAPQTADQFRADLTADNQVALSWRNPETEDFDYVRITRSSQFFPNDPLVGELVYEGRGERTIDAPAAGQTHFYSAFVRTEDGSWSAPSLAAVSVPTRPDQQPDDEPEDEPTEDVSEIIEDQPEAPTSTRSLLDDLSFDDLVFSQPSGTARISPTVVRLTAGGAFVTALDYDVLPEVLKTIVVSLEHPEERSKAFSFLLRADNNKEFYSASIGALTAGDYRARVTVLDYKNRRVKTVDGLVRVEPKENADATQASAASTEPASFPFVSSILAGLLLLFLLLAVISGWKAVRPERRQA